MNFLCMNHSLRNIFGNMLENVFYINKPTKTKHIFTKRNIKNLKIDTRYSDDDVYSKYKEAINESRRESVSHKWEYYKIYLKQLYGSSEFSMDESLNVLKRIKYDIVCRSLDNNSTESNFITKLVKKNRYFSKSKKRPGVIVKLFRSFYDGSDVIVKVYLYDPMCESLQTSVKFNFDNEVLFQNYANKLQEKVDFISPELYSWGEIKFQFVLDGYKYNCLYLIMEYIPYLTLKEATYTSQNMKYIYEKVCKINENLSQHLLHHNDLHRGNIVVRNPSSPFPDIILLDYGEASIGPKTPMFIF